MTALYNEIDPYAAQWIRNLIAAGHVAQGDVDDRSIKEVTPAELARFTQFHTFAGIAVWSHALRAAGWPDDVPVWTGSCPCQPFSDAGAGEGFADPRHLWPDWFKLIDACRPAVVFGEQVASKDGLAWLDLVRTDLEGAGYAFGVLDSCAAGYGAPHIRQRFYFAGVRVADAHCLIGRQGGALKRGGHPRGPAESRPGSGRGGFVGGLGNADGEHPRGDAGASDPAEGRAPLWAGADVSRASGAASRGLVDAIGARSQGLAGHGNDGREPRRIHAHEVGPAAAPGPTGGFWTAADWLLCRDEPINKWRPVEPGTFPLAHGAAGRVGRLRAYGNGLVAPQAIEFIKAVMQFLGWRRDENLRGSARRDKEKIRVTY